MPIPEAQLKTWSGLGSVKQSKDTYETIRNVLNDSTSPYYVRNFSIFLQGSYGNDTNIYGDSDVDIVIRLDDAFASDLSKLEQTAVKNYDTTYPDATYSVQDFKVEVLGWLTKKFGADVRPGNKAVFIKANGNRRDADVLVCTKLRRYWEGSTGTDSKYDEGICFFTADGTRIVNFPEQHSGNCTIKHQATGSWFKHMVRVYKNMRNRMVADGYLQEGVAPSYFLEGMLWSVPNEKFGGSYYDSFKNTFEWLMNADKTKLACASDLYWLVRDNSHNCWPTANYDAYLAATEQYWNDWL